MIKLFLILFIIIPFVHAEEPINYIKYRNWYSGYCGLDDYFLVRKIKYNQDYWYIMNPAEIKTSDGKVARSGVIEKLLADDSKTMFSIKEEDLSACLSSTENKVSTFFPPICEPEVFKMTTEEYKNVFRCLCKAKPDEAVLFFQIDKLIKGIRW
ncbi:MAG: hypothetical protein NTY22_03190 [Proteobacteria bacterium]|nr:hypothetical protein [Pseudomonadota bacterium]